MCTPQYNVCSSVVGHHNPLVTSYVDAQATSINEKVVSRLESAESMLIQMDRKVDLLRKEKHSTTNQMKKLAKRLSSVSQSRDQLPMAIRNFNKPTNRKLTKRNKEVIESQVNLGLSDSKSGNSRNKDSSGKNKNNSRYDKDFSNFEDEQEIAIDTSTEKLSLKNYTIGSMKNSTIKHAVANLADNSNDYSEDMDESVAFSKGLSDKENKMLPKKISPDPNKIVVSKRNKNKVMKTNRSEYNSNLNPLNYTSNPKRLKGFQVNHPDKRRASYLN